MPNEQPETETQEHYNTGEAIRAQADYCDRTGAPHFAPNDGRCYRCNQNIYAENAHPVEKLPRGKVQILYNAERQTRGITVEYAAKHLITGCPHCCWSFCD